MADIDEPNLPVRTRGAYNAVTNDEPSTSGSLLHARAATPADSDLTIRQTGVTNGTTHAADSATCLGDGSPVSLTNPMPTYIVGNAPGTEVHDYDTQAALAAAGVDNHDYAVPTGTFSLAQVYATASGAMKVEVQYTTDGIAYTTLKVGFKSASGPDVCIKFEVPYVRASGANVAIRVVRTNLENKAQDVYSTIEGILN